MKKIMSLYYELNGTNKRYDFFVFNFLSSKSFINSVQLLL